MRPPLSSTTQRVNDDCLMASDGWSTCSGDLDALCFNGGTCYFNYVEATFSCRCLSGYTGPRCGELLPESTTEAVTTTASSCIETEAQAQHRKAMITAVTLLSAVVLVLVLCFVVYVRTRNDIKRFGEEMLLDKWESVKADSDGIPPPSIIPECKIRTDLRKNDLDVQLQPTKYNVEARPKSDDTDCKTEATPLLLDWSTPWVPNRTRSPVQLIDHRRETERPQTLLLPDRSCPQCLAEAHKLSKRNAVSDATMVNGTKPIPRIDWLQRPRLTAALAHLNLSHAFRSAGRQSQAVQTSEQEVDHDSTVAGSAAFRTSTPKQFHLTTSENTLLNLSYDSAGRHLPSTESSPGDERRSIHART